MMKCQVLSAAVTFQHQPFARPLQLSSGTITEITEATATVQVVVDGREATGRGSIYLSDLWAWPDPALMHAQRDAAMRAHCTDFAHLLPDHGGPPAHPLELGLRLHERLTSMRDSAVPLLARLVCGSPFDAAIHDAAGHALECSAFSFYDSPCPAPSVDALFPNSGAIEAIRRFLRRPPAEALDGWYVVSGTDPLTDDFAGFVRERGFRAFKLKTHGKDPDADAARTAEVYRAALGAGAREPRLSADSNEGNADAASVLAYLDALERRDPEAFAALEYLEQPTARNIVSYAYDWQSVSLRRPVLVDEGLTGFDILPHVTSQGWTGICLKTCKGHSFNLAAGAWAHARGLKIAVQDLTNPGLAAIHSCLLAQHVPSSMASNSTHRSSPPPPMKHGSRRSQGSSLQPMADIRSIHG